MGGRLTWFAHECWYCGHKSKEVDALYSTRGRDYQCEDHEACEARRAKRHGPKITLWSKRRVSIGLSRGGHMDVSLPGRWPIPEETLEALREIGEAAMERMEAEQRAQDRADAMALDLHAHVERKEQ